MPFAKSTTWSSAQNVDKIVARATARRDFPSEFSELEPELFATAFKAAPFDLCELFLFSMSRNGDVNIDKK